MSVSGSQIKVQDIDHLGIVAGIVDEMGLVEEINQLLGTHPQEIISVGQVVKAMIINGLGFVSAPLYLFHKFFEGIATEHLLGEGIQPEHLNDDRLGRVLDKLYDAGLTEIFIRVALSAASKFGVKMDSFHLDSSSFHVHGDYGIDASDEASAESGLITITYGYSRDHRPDLKQFILDLMCSGDGDIPLYLRVADGNEVDSAMFGKLIADFHKQWQIDGLFVADAALYTEENLQMMVSLRWVTRVPGTLTAAKELLENTSIDAFVASTIPGYRIAPYCNNYGGVRQRWLVVESEARKESDLKKLEKRLAKKFTQAQSQLRKLCQQKFACAKDALTATKLLESQLPFHQLANIEVIEHAQHRGRGRPRQDSKPTRIFQIKAEIIPKETAITLETERAGRFILATNVLDASELSDEQVLREYKAQQSTERGFRFLKDPLFFTSTVFLNSSKRVAALAMVMGLCLLVYSLGQRTLRQSLERASQTIQNQLGKPTATPTLRWVFQCFMSIHLLTYASLKQISNLSEERCWILKFFGAPCRKYYLLC
ncbi:IS1634 family transposase [Moorena sp. SIO3H5]|uniref:IS1634 family transposase n=1 Tax=Moorena sp. SIO3H5 TaxID=2607834 RepID=UPI0013BABDB0|nr:IS1634 family transposase [Moorena sp. SIO3H5]NEO74528.1 IS1634 family transposase [Moorena sp. SIO3H5]